MTHFITRLSASILLLTLIACEKQQLSYPDTWGTFEPSEQELAELIAIIERNFKNTEEKWNNKIDYSDFSSHTLPGYTNELFASIHFAPTYSTDKVRHYAAVNCEKDTEKNEDWDCEKVSARAIHYSKNKTWVPIAGNSFSDGDGIRFFDTLSTMTTIPVALGKDLITEHITFSYLAEEDDNTLSAEILDQKIGASRIVFSSAKGEAPAIAAIIKLTYDCVDQNHRTVSSRFPCDHQSTLQH
ncbi:MAG: hypothetical protein ACRBBR_00595 [Cellvibrionaceae bacterium]